MHPKTPPDSFQQPTPAQQEDSPSAPLALAVPVPSIAYIPASASSSPLTPVICDERAISRLLETLLWRSGLTIREAARLLGVDESSVREHTSGRTQRPSLLWFVKFAAICGATLTIQMPERR